VDTLRVPPLTAVEKQEEAIVVRLTSVEVRVMLAALNTALNRPALFRPAVMAMAEELSVRLIESLRASRSDASEDGLAIGDLSAPDELPPGGTFPYPRKVNPP
jgi:hypothetical protein